MIIELDMNSSIPIYVQLRNQIVMGIGHGELKPGESLPTVRQLAEDAGVNTMTVNKTYQILKTEGYINIDRRHGAVVAKNIDMDVNPLKNKKLTAIRSSGRDEAMLLTPPRIFSLEEALEWINDDELVEVTPDAIRIRKKGLTAQDRRNLYREKMAQNKD